MADFAVDNAASLFIDQPLAEGLGSRTAVATPERAYTYAELAALVDRAAHGLRRLGIEPEQRVGLLMADGIGFAGRTPRPKKGFTRTDCLTFCFAHSQPDLEDRLSI